ncbi:F-box/RNI-like superfamily protein [Euphorbia peplus]|nr:F-box/RNI-like superfamily protein [Euphorbia peplus]
MDSGATSSPETAATSSEPKGKKRVTEDVDFISGLPDELLHEILSYLSLRESVRTSILSHRWRYVSAFRALVRFNWQEMFIREGANAEFWLAGDERPCMTFTKMITRAINKYIRFYKGEKIDLLEVNFCFCHYAKRITKYEIFEYFVDHFLDDAIDGWIKFALGKGVESLSLFTQCQFRCCKGCNTYNPHGAEFECGFNYVFRTELFDGIAMDLKHLKLRSCKFGPNFTNQLSSLQTISLYNVDCLATNLESMFPFLGNLEILEITSCVLPKYLSLEPLTRLQRFLVHTPGSIEEIEVYNDDLIEFKCSDTVYCDLSGAPSLMKLNYVVPVGQIDLVFTDWPLLNPDLRILFLLILDAWVNWVPPRSVRTPSQVTHIRMMFLEHSDFSLVRAIAFLKAFPLLRLLVLAVTCEKDLEEEEEPELSYVPEHLTEINLPRFDYTPKQMEFAIYLLENASALEKMSVGSIKPYGVEEEHVLHSKLREMDKRKILV